MLTIFEQDMPHGKRLTTNQPQGSFVDRQRLPVATYEPRGEFLNSFGGNGGVDWLGLLGFRLPSRIFDHGTFEFGL